MDSCNCIAIKLKSSIYRVNELALLYNIIASGQMAFCPDNDDQTDFINGTTNGTSNDADDDVKKFTDVARYITFYSVCIEVSLGYITFWCFFIKFSVMASNPKPGYPT